MRDHSLSCTQILNSTEEMLALQISAAQQQKTIRSLLSRVMKGQGPL